MKTGLRLGSLALAALAPIAPAAAQQTGTTTVQATADIYRAATPLPGGPSGSTLDGTDPVAIDLGSATSITFTVTANQVTVNSGGNYNDADGIGSAQGEYNSGFGTFSSINATTAGFLAGVIRPSPDPRTTQAPGLDSPPAAASTSPR